ncbi:MAG: hypothetical protein HY301_01880 [Verrucomicrobia bacterium]|nr:hypothetical protein [Verrucomicrobiota bacterium]
MLPLLSAFANEPAPKSARELFNDGTARLRDGKLREAEGALQAAVNSQREELQPPALYNLGHVRFQQGAAVLKESASPGATRARGEGATAIGDGALRAADAALAGNEFEAILSAYLQGRGARRELKGATEAVKKAMDAYGAVLNRWRRASGDFKSAEELQPKNADAKFNANVVDQNIAQLVDQVNQMQQQQQQMGGQRDELKKKMQELKGKMPGQQQPPGMGDDEDDDEDDGKKQPQQGDKEGPNRDGKEQQISPEDAMRLLETMRLDGNRKLPLTEGKAGDPKSKTGKTW